MRKFLPAALAVQLVGMALLAGSPALRAQSTGNEAGDKNARQARVALDAMVKALGGDAWLNMKNQLRQGRIADFYHGKPSGGEADYWEYHSWPDRDRIEFTKHRDVVQFFVGRAGWEVTYKGKSPLPQDIVDDFLRRRDHSIETVVKVWLKDPRTILIYEGQHLAERHLAEQVMLISAENEAVTILMDAQTHLPLRRSFEWRDPLYKDKNVDAEEYDDYHLVEGLPTAFTVTRFKNDDMTSQKFLLHGSYNVDLAPDFWSIDDADKRIKK